EINDLTEFEIPNQTQAPTGPLKIQDYSGIDPFSQKAAAAENAIVSTKQSAVHVAKPSGLPKGYLSYSQIDLFLRCPFAYYQRYFSKMQVDSDKVAAEFGKLIHKVLEETYNWVKSSKYRGKFPLETAYDFLKKFWAHPEHGMAGARPEFWLDARDILRKYAQENAMVDCADVLAVE
ncbi:hypothetical protein GWN42_19790, partial [candidate division KSB1 bacterium]|nr:PD-(D/E)XK nuclease family protein [Phycisphaerae bacterium]NIV94966.1 hypothetical protein [candidate division KSB1 bacterium]NIX30053.1 hypothetical protein [Phycisphaerae bacterium]